MIPKTRPWLWIGLLTAVCCVIFALEILVGRAGWPTGPLLGLRLTRALIAVMVGAGLAVSGAALQALFHNPLADPYVLGTASGGALGYAVGLFAGLNSLASLFWPSVVGSTGFLLAVFWLSKHNGRLISSRMLLAGVMAGFFASAGVAVLMILARQNTLRTFYVLWGNIGVVISPGDIPGLVVAGIGVVVCAAWLVSLSKPLDALSLGEAEAGAMGVDVEKLKIGVFLASGIIVGLSVAVVGAVGFVGLMVPHFIRKAISPRHAPLLVGSFVGGAGLVLASDLFLRVIGFYQLPVGVLTSLMGVPFFLYIMRRSSWS